MKESRAASLQIAYNVLRREQLETILGGMAGENIGIIARSPLEYGLLSGKYGKSAVFPEGDHRAGRWTPEEWAGLIRKVEALRFLVRGEVKSLAEASLRFVLSNPRVSVVIPGARTAAQVEEQVRASGGPPYLPEEDLNKIGTT
jgi:aryl-alcohol dehydrogenase-like predicted oxidoreductase